MLFYFVSAAEFGSFWLLRTALQVNICILTLVKLLSVNSPPPGFDDACWPLETYKLSCLCVCFSLNDCERLTN